MKIYNVENQILGRLCSVIAKNLLKGEKVTVVNCEKSVISGNSKLLEKTYLEKLKRGDVYHGPFFPKYPDAIFRRTVRGMLPWHKTSGRNAFKSLKVYIGIPEEFKNKKMEKLEKFDASRLRTKFISLGHISLSMGADKRW